ncbi:MAG: HDOD domain-containing protein, partial [Mariprofundaceae bacterium]
MNPIYDDDPGFDRESTLELLGLTEDLPSLPEYFMRIQGVIQDPRSGAADLAAVIGSDQATTAMVMKFANSPAFNPTGTPVLSLEQAIARLGTRETAHVAQTMSLMYGLILPTGMSNVRIFWAHAFAVSLASERIARAIDPDARRVDHQQIFTAGLLHDIGRVALGLRVDLGYFERKTGHLFGDALVELERAYYGVDHAEAGDRLLRHWRLPDPLCVAIAEHHDPAGK